MPQQFHLADLFEAVAAAVPDRLAIRSDAGTLTYAELDERSDRIAAGLRAQGIARGDTVGLYMMNRPEYLESLLAAVKIGAVPFNINYRYQADELRYLLANARCRAVVHDAGFAATLAAAAADLPDLTLTISVGSSENRGDAGMGGVRQLSYEALLATPPTKGFDRSENDIVLLYTGGTTGMPKGVMWPHKAFFFACLGGGGHFHPAGPISEPGDIADRARGGYQLTIFPVAPLMHGAAIWTACSALLGGLTLALDPMAQFDAEAIWDRVDAQGVNIIQIVGDAMAGPLRDALEANPGRWSLGHVVNFGSGGAVFSAHLKAAIKAHLPNATITDGMGSSEGGISGVALPSDEGMMRIPAHADQQVIVDDRLARPGETGLVGRSGHTPIGYFGDEAKTREVFRMVEGRLWTVSGDLGRLDEDGMITVFGRGSTCINSGGEKIFPEEVESAIREHPAVRDCVVVGQPDPRWGEAVVALVSAARADAPPSAEAIGAFLNGKLAGYKRPKRVIVVPDIRRSPAGKQDYAWARETAAMHGEHAA